MWLLPITIEPPGSDCRYRARMHLGHKSLRNEVRRAGLIPLSEKSEKPIIYFQR